VLLQRGFLVAEGAVKLKVTYPLLPWIGVILLGYVCGPLYARGDGAGAPQALLADRRRRAAGCCWCCAV
jgi:uncharacterized membrane protein